MGDSPGPPMFLRYPVALCQLSYLLYMQCPWTSQDLEAGLIDCSDIDLSVEDAHEVETVDDFVVKCAVGVSMAQEKHNALLF